MIIFTSKDCKYCDKLKKGLDLENINYREIDVEDENHRTEIDDLYKFVEIELVPVIAMKPHLLVPTKSFNTIDEAIEIIKSLLK